ncbi:MAG: hypothetical protein WCN95_09710 [bacterium]
MNATAIIVFAALAWVGVNTAVAGPTVMTPETWTAAGLQGWGSAGDASVTRDGVVNNPYLLISFAGGGAPPAPYQATISTVGSPATTLFTGNYIAANVASANFSFSNSVNPSTVSLVFGANAHAWSRTFTPVSINHWNTYNIYFNYSLEWTSPGNDAATFLADLQAVSWIGINIVSGGTGPEEYGLDNFQLMIPEPADFCLLAAGVLGMALALRRKPLSRHWSTGIHA